jgi:hypothetical protein
MSRFAFPSRCLPVLNIGVRVGEFGHFRLILCPRVGWRGGTSYA